MINQVANMYEDYCQLFVSYLNHSPSFVRKCRKFCLPRVARVGK